MKKVFVNSISTDGKAGYSAISGKEKYSDSQEGLDRYQATYMAIILALTKFSSPIKIMCDRNIVVKQLNGEMNVRSDNILTYHIDAKRILDGRDVEVVKIDKENNKKSLEYAKKAIK